MKKSLWNIFLSSALTLMAILTIWLTTLLFKPIKIETAYIAKNSMTTYVFHADGTYTKKYTPPYEFNSKPNTQTSKGFYTCENGKVYLMGGGVFDKTKYKENPNTIAFIVPCVAVGDIVLIGFIIKVNRKKEEVENKDDD